LGPDLEKAASTPVAVEVGVVGRGARGLTPPNSHTVHAKPLRCAAIMHAPRPTLTLCGEQRTCMSRRRCDGVGLGRKTQMISTIIQVDRSSIFALRRSTLDFCLGGQRFLRAKGNAFDHTFPDIPGLKPVTRVVGHNPPRGEQRLPDVQIPSTFNPVKPKPRTPCCEQTRTPCCEA